MFVWAAAATAAALSRDAKYVRGPHAGVHRARAWLLARQPRHTQLDVRAARYNESLMAAGVKPFDPL